MRVKTFSGTVIDTKIYGRVILWRVALGWIRYLLRIKPRCYECGAKMKREPIYRQTFVCPNCGAKSGRS